jgi:hypothetical protein
VPANSVGVVEVPKKDLELWLQTYYLKPPVGTFVAWGPVTVTGDTVEAIYATSTEEQPEPPVKRP